MRKILIFFLFINTAYAKNEKIYFISHAGAGDSFWNVAYKGCTQAGEDFKAQVHFMAPESPNDISRQIEILDAVIASKPDAIALTIPNDLAFSRSLKKAETLKIPVIAVNSRPKDTFKNHYHAFVGMDDYEAGKKVAEHAYASGRIKNRVVIANHQPGHNGLENRQRGIYEVITHHNIPVEKIDVSADVSTIASSLESHLKHFPDTSTIFCLGPPCAEGIGRYFKDKHLYIVTFDLSSFTIQLIKEGLIAFTIDQQPYQQTYKSIEQLVLLLRKNEQTRNIDTGGSFVSLENADSVFELVKKGLR